MTDGYTYEWLQEIATGHYGDAEPGDVGTTVLTHDGKRFEVTVECLADEAVDDDG